MSKIMKCDVCGKEFDGGFSVDVNVQGGIDLEEFSDDRFEIGKKDVCRECYFSVKKMLTCCCRAPHN